MRPQFGMLRCYVQTMNSPEELVKDIESGLMTDAELSHAAEFLGLIRIELAVPLLVKLLRHEKVVVREGAVYGCLRHPSVDLYKELDRMVRRDSSEAIRVEAKHVLEVWAEDVSEVTRVMQEKSERIAKGVNKVELIEYSGSDLGHALSAWTSTSRDLTDEKRARVPNLLQRLARDQHHTPFEKSYMRFLVTCDIATHIHILKHRIGVSVNGESARYKELGEKKEDGSRDDKFYVPQDWDLEDQIEYVEHLELCLKKYHDTYARLLAKGFSKKRAKESARFYIPYGSQLLTDVSFNFRSFMHFLGLRHTDHAQVEVREVSRVMLKMLWDTGDFCESLKAFGWTEEKINGTL